MTAPGPPGEWKIPGFRFQRVARCMAPQASSPGPAEFCMARACSVPTPLHSRVGSLDVLRAFPCPARGLAAGRGLVRRRLDDGFHRSADGLPWIEGRRSSGSALSWLDIGPGHHTPGTFRAWTFRAAPTRTTVSWRRTSGAGQRPGWCWRGFYGRVPHGVRIDPAARPAVVALFAGSMNALASGDTNRPVAQVRPATVAGRLSAPRRAGVAWALVTQKKSGA